jgi:ferredoxin
MRISPAVCCPVRDIDYIRVAMAYRVELDSVACIGCAACTSCEYFEMHPDMKAHAVQKVVVEIVCVRDVAESCPVGAIAFSDISSQNQIKRSRR